jgi:ubiquinone/menaquinone biosynthesis C-methylase UbiE
MQYHGADVSEKALQNVCPTYQGRPDVELTKLDSAACTLPWNDNSFDLVLAVWALEHFAHPREYLDEIRRVCCRGGYVILIAPNHELPFSYLNALRHKNRAYRILLAIRRAGDYLLRIIGVWRFRVLEQNFVEATSRYEKPDDDLKYLVSTYEVVEYLKAHSMEMVRVDALPRTRQGSSIRASVRFYVQRLITYLPAMRYYGVSLFIIAQKK